MAHGTARSAQINAEMNYCGQVHKNRCRAENSDDNLLFISSTIANL